MMDAKKILTNKCFCPLPWTGLMYNFDGTIKNCIRSSGPIGNIKDNNIHDILLGADNVKTQEDMLAQKPGSRCSPCYDLEVGKNSFDIISDRIFYIKELRTVSPDTYKLNNHELHSIDIRWSNLCNSACVYCGPEFSSKWASELNKFLPTPSEQQLQEFKEYIFKHVEQFKHVYLAGGEPLLMRENLELLEQLQQKNPDVHLRINTNLSKTNTNIFEKICEFKNVHWIIRVESLGSQFDYIRYGNNWLDFRSNLETIQKLGHKVTFNMLHCILNFLSLWHCIHYLQKMGFKDNSFIIGPLESPLYLNSRHLHEIHVQWIINKIDYEISHGAEYLYLDSLINLKTYLEQPFERDLETTFNRLKELDKRRGIDSRKVFPELYLFTGY